METVKSILSKIDLSKIETKYIDIDSISEEVGIYEYLTQKDIKLTYCWLNKWICTDTEVGIKIWYLNNVPVCISHQPGRKFDETFKWISLESFKNTHQYLLSLVTKKESIINLINDETFDEILESFKEIQNKRFEEINF